jgi:hypothetical protein
MLSMFYALFVSRESGWIDRREDGKFMEKRVSTVWLHCQRGKKAQFWWTPSPKPFRPKMGRKYRLTIQFDKRTK